MILDGDKDYIPKKLGARIKNIRLSKNIPAEVLAVECGVSNSFYSDIETGGVDVSYLTLVQIASYLEISVVELIGDI